MKKVQDFDFEESFGALEHRFARDRSSWRLEIASMILIIVAGALFGVTWSDLIIEGPIGIVIGASVGGALCFFWVYWSFRKYHIFRGEHYVVTIEDGRMTSLCRYRPGMENAPVDPKRVVLHVFTPAVFQQARIVLDSVEQAELITSRCGSCKVDAHGRVIPGSASGTTTVSHGLTHVLFLLKIATRSLR